MQRNERLCLLFLGLPQCQSPELQARFASPSLEASLVLSSEKKTASPTKSSFGFPIANLHTAIFVMKNLLHTDLRDFWS